MLLIVGEKEETLITPVTNPKDEQQQEKRSNMAKQDVDNGNSALHHSHHHKDKHHHPPPAVEDMLEERSHNQQALAQPAKCMLTNARESYIGPIMAVAIVVIAILIYSAGTFSTHDVVKDGGTREVVTSRCGLPQIVNAKIISETDRRLSMEPHRNEHIPFLLRHYNNFQSQRRIISSDTVQPDSSIDER
ncbi:hypothetical protein MRB53_042186 [Persea americana]|nr:hypothetical protein MRB53_042186 [Persea americana]